MRVRTVRRPPGQGGRQEAVEDSATNGSGRAVRSPRLGEHINYRCPVCGDGGGDATYKPTRYGDNDWLVGCWSPECERDRRYLPKLGDAFGLGEAASKEQIVSALRLIGRAGRRREAKPLPSAATVEGWHARLAGSGHALGYLTQRRGIAPAVLRRERIGWDGDRLTFPMFDPAHKLVALKTRAPKAGVQMRAWPGEGRAWPLYPPVDRRRDWTMLVAGELDALAARSAGLPASSVTLGAGHWRDDWTADLAGLRVVVCFDNNEEQQARACRGAAIGRDRRPPAQSPRAGARSAEGRPERLPQRRRRPGAASPPAARETQTLVDDLAERREQAKYAVADLHPSGGNSLLVAEKKAGKTTLALNLVQALADDDPFLGHFAVQPMEGRVAFFNYEISPDMFREWADDIDIAHPERVVRPLHLRGRSLRFWEAEALDRLATWLRGEEVEWLIVDPAARAWSGLVTNENNNTEVGAFTDALDVLKEAAGIANLLLATHTVGEAQGR